MLGRIGRYFKVKFINDEEMLRKYDTTLFGTTRYIINVPEHLQYRYGLKVKIVEHSHSVQIFGIFKHTSKELAITDTMLGAKLLIRRHLSRN